MAVLFPTRWPLGIDVLKEQFTAIGENRLFAYQKPYIDRLGPNFEAKLLGSSGFTTADPVNIEAVLCSRFEGTHLPKRLEQYRLLLIGFADYVMGMRRPALLPFIGEGIFIQDGEAWKHSREMLRRPFLKSHYQNLEGFKGPIERLLATLSSSDGVVDLQPLFFKFTLATTTALIFGQSIDDIDDHDQASFATNFDYASLISSLRIRLMNFYWLYAPSNYRRSCERVRKFADEFVRRALEVEKDDKAEKSEHDYAFIMDLHKGIRDPALVRDQLVNVLLAGRDTTACLLSWAFFLLIRHPASLERLRDEIHSVAADDQEITRAHIQKMAYLKCILNETLRLYPSVPINLRIADKPTFLPRGGGSDGNAPVLVRPGISVGILPYYMHRRQDLYGEDATDFRPERWEGSKLANIGYGYIPFHGGPRLCLGSECPPIRTIAGNTDYFQRTLP